MKDELYKTTIVIWTEYDPRDPVVDIHELAKEAVDGNAICSKMKTVGIEQFCLEDDEDFDNDVHNFFLGEDEEEEDDENDAEGRGGLDDDDL